MVKTSVYESAERQLQVLPSMIFIFSSSVVRSSFKITSSEQHSNSITMLSLSTTGN